MSPDGRPIRVLVVEDSRTVRARIVAALRSDPAFEVVGEAGDGETAIQECQRLRPDLVTMDMMLPGLSGLAATEQLMQHCPTPILVISSADNRAGFIDTIAALDAGAVDVLDKPLGRDTTGGNDAWDREFLRTCRLVSRIRVIRRIGHHASVPAARTPEPLPPQADPSHPYSLVAIGASTGGPTAVATVLRTLPATFALPILLVLHVHESFGNAFASWLAEATDRRVRLAVSGEPLTNVRPGEVVMAPPGRHLRVRSNTLLLTDEPERHSCRPSVDVLFESLAQSHGPRVAACLLTGMGKDGAAGMLEIDRTGGLTIAQDEATSVVFGMPGEAVRLGGAQHVLPIDRIGPALGRLTVPSDLAVRMRPR
ncbi:chemotaxis-specific protein-glutamate methyltransferase CheB [Kineosporia rhizophila]|uniref:chemotaxis-specific protein-glutamate methyltransferase CheB n=1 Tax=Kineosporia TaxID=49184 RepID=UPI001E459A9A|nr:MULTISPECIES: chemotaxis-specific protein-glutamate methyltransferase CheB [Kineosporia]MCE0535717.1 chemotaxis-specific protein-glutamate methyltransferase CheB [Kineosporia rhizophila]GLY17634.1 chemotaxis response regulator protein-glutamate methylesterase [Kineosporia sp. NBRC 101677]